MTTLGLKRFTAELKADGTVSAVFSTDDIDSQGDVTLPTAFTDGAEVPIAAFGHSWDRLPIGRGRVTVLPHGARLDGVFFDHPEAQATRETLKGLGPLAQWSFGFLIKESHPATVRGQAVRVLDAVDLFEVSPVLVGANRAAHSLAVRGQPQDGGRAAQDQALRQAYARHVLQPEIRALEREIAQREALLRELPRWQARDRRIAALLGRTA